MIGRTLGHYRVVEPLGAGGMGEVFRAHDEKLDRDVALKVLPAGALNDEESRKRFQREANALSRLSHPHIATIHDFDTAEGVDFLVMELVRGPSLRDELEEKGALPEKTVVRLGAQLAHGLQAAHEQGIVHRDLKPANLQLTPDGLLKILDFGLARLLPKEPAPGEATAPTQTAVRQVAGTLPYMSPEQLRGRGVDARTDLYAAGAVLYEMTTGKRLFSKPSSAELTDAILHEDPTPPREVNERISPGLEAVILKALDKDPELRYQTAQDFHVDLERLQQRTGPHSVEGHGAATPPDAGSGGGRRRGLVIGAGGALALLALGAWLIRPVPPPRVTQIRPLHIDVGPDFRFPISSTWATDGVRVYYVARKEGRYGLYQVGLGGGEPSEIPTPFGGLEVHGYLKGPSALVVTGWLESDPPVLGADPRQVWLLPVPKGAPRRLAGVEGRSVAVSPDEQRLAVASGRQLTLVSSDGGEIHESLEVPGGGIGWIRWSPDGRRLRYQAFEPPGYEPQWWIWETSPRGEAAPRPLWPGRQGDWTPDGRYFLFDRGDIYAVRERALLPWDRGRPVRLTFGPLQFQHVAQSPGGEGLLAFGAGLRGEAHRLDSRAGHLEPILGGESVAVVVPSPDGEWVAWVTYPERVLWRSRPDGSNRTQLSAAAERVLWAVWSPDGTRIAFVSNTPPASASRLRLVPSDGGAVETLLEEPDGNYWDACWLGDGRSLVFSDGYRNAFGIRQLDIQTKNVAPFEGGERLLYPKCGPQGQLLASGPNEDGDGWSFHAYWPGEGWVKIGPETLGFPSWRRDGQSFCGLDLDATKIQCYSVRTQQQETVFDLGQTRLMVDVPGFPWMGLDHDDQPLVIVDRGTRDFYALDWEAP